jgi:hypothetical protein
MNIGRPQKEHNLGQSRHPYRKQGSKHQRPGNQLELGDQVVWWKATEPHYRKARFLQPIAGHFWNQEVCHGGNLRLH